MILEDALSWTRQNAGGPFFLHLALQQPHLDLNAPDAWRDRYLGRFDESPIPDSHYRAESHPKATFAAMVAYLDDTVGRVLDELESLGIAERTLVLFASDNGPVDSGGWSAENFDSSGELRGSKRDLYEGGVRTPLIAWWPGRVAAGTTTDHISAFWDFAPTACELAGAELGWATDGLSYAPTLLGRGDQQEHEYLYWESYERGGKQAVRSGDWKAVRRKTLRRPNAPIELYNLATDLAESDDVAAYHPEVVRRLAGYVEEAHQPSGRYRMPPPAERE